MMLIYGLLNVSTQPVTNGYPISRLYPTLQNGSAVQWSNPDPINQAVASACHIINFEAI